MTDSGNFLIDWKFEIRNDEDDFDYDWKSINMSIKMIPGNLIFLFLRFRRVLEKLTKFFLFLRCH